MSATTSGSSSPRPTRRAAAREGALSCLAADEPLERQVPRFLSALADGLPLEWAALAAAPRSGAAPDLLAWRRRSGESGFDLAEEIPPGLLIAPGGAAPEPVRGREGLPHLARIPLGEDPSAACFWIGRSGGRPFRANELERFGVVWQALAAALRRDLRARASELESRERSAELSTVFEVVRAAGRALDFDGLFQSIAAALTPLVDLDALAVLIDLDGRREIALHPAGPLGTELSEALAGACRQAYRRDSGRAADGLPLRVVPLPGYDPEELVPPGRPRLFETFPLMRRGECVGSLAFASSRGRPGETTTRILATAAGQASLTVDRLQSGAEAQARQLRAVLDSLADGLVMTEPTGRVALSNPAGLEHLQALTGAVPDVLADLGGLTFRELASEALSRGRATAEITLARERKIFRIGVHPLPATGGGAGGFVVTSTDVTEARALQEQMLQTEKLSSLGELISGVAHELNNPLAAVMGYAQLLQEADLDGDLRRRLGIIASEAGRCQAIVRNLLSFARKHRPERRALSLNEIVHSVLGLLDYQLRVEGIEVDLQLDAGLPAIHGDPHQLQQALVNLISNAQHALKQAAAARRLTLRTSRLAEGGVRIEVEDTGPGIPPEVLPKIFDPFFTTKEVGAGTGLGLSIVFGIVESHQGRTSAGAGATGGALFTIDLPSGAEAEPQAAGGSREEVRRPVDRPRVARSILVVEDEEAIAALLRDALGGEGHRVDTAGDGGVARERLIERDYDLIITDLKMPRAGGRELYEEIVERRPELAGRFIFATGDVVSTEAREFFRRTGRPCLEKPFDVADLRRLVRSMLDRGDA